MHPKLFAALLVCVLATSAAKGEEQPPEISLQSLLGDGYAIVAMQYLPQSMVFTLQRHADAYVCDATLNGKTKLCVKLK